MLLYILPCFTCIACAFNILPLHCSCLQALSLVMQQQAIKWQHLTCCTAWCCGVLKHQHAPQGRECLHPFWLTTDQWPPGVCSSCPASHSLQCLKGLWKAVSVMLMALILHSSGDDYAPCVFSTNPHSVLATTWSLMAMQAYFDHPCSETHIFMPVSLQTAGAFTQQSITALVNRTTNPVIL